MSGRGGQADQCIAKAVAFKLQCPDARIPEAMLASKFTVAESQNPAKQMAVRRAYEKATGGKTAIAIAVAVTITNAVAVAAAETFAVALAFAVASP